MMSLLSGPAANPFEANANGNVAVSLDGTGQFVVNPAFIADLVPMLDAAHARGLEVVMAPAWGNAHIHGPVCTDLNMGPLNASTAYELGKQVAQAIGQHPAISAWLYGGDNWCAQGVAEDVNIWRNFDQGIIDGGGGAIPVGYHSPNGGEFWFKTEPWMDFHAIQTSHCTLDGELTNKFNWIKSQVTKPIWAAEMRYEAIEPDFCTRPEDHAPGNPVTATNVESDGQEALDAGVDAIGYGHNERWLWGNGFHGSAGLGWQSVKDSFQAPGELLLLDLLGVVPTLPPPPTSSTTTTVSTNVLRSATVGYSAADAAGLQNAAAYLNMSPAEVQRGGIFVAKFITALGGNVANPQPIAEQFKPSTNGPVQYTSTWTDPTEVTETLDWATNHYGVTDEQAHFIGASLLSFLAAIDEARNG